MKKLCTLVLILILCFIVFSISEIGLVKSEAETIVVPDNYSTIQEAIDNADLGDTIFMKAGVYFENVDVDKSLSLVGEDKETTVIDGGKSGVVLKVLRDGANITGFTIQNSNDLAS